MKPGDAIGPYVIDSLLGAGGMGVVWKAHAADDGAVVVLKSIRTRDEDPELAARFRVRLLREARMLERLRHEHVVRSLGVLEHDGDVCLVLELIEGRTFEQCCADPGFPLRDRLLVLRQVAAALQHAESLGITHRDLKPANVMVAAGPSAKVLDFGLARAVDSTRLTATGIVCGTVPYMAPEQARGGAGDGRSDIFSLGMMMAHALGLRRPFVEGNISETYARLVSLRPVDVDESLPDDVRAGLMRLLAKLPEDRIDTAGQVMAWLDDLRAEGDGLDARMARARAAVGTAQPPRLPELERPDADMAWAFRMERLGSGAGGILLVLALPGSGRSSFTRRIAESCEAAGIAHERHAFVEDGLEHLAVLRMLGSAADEATCDIGAAADATRTLMERRELQGIDAAGVTRCLELVRSRARDEEGFALILDDLQFATASELAWVDELVRMAREERLLLVLVGDPAAEGAGPRRAEAYGAFLSRCAAATDVERILLAPLDDESIVTALKKIRVPEDVARRLAPISGGRPGVVNDLLREWHAGGSVESVVRKASPELAFRLRNRWKLLSEPARTIVRGLVEAGGALTMKELETVAGLRRLSLRARLLELEGQHGWVRVYEDRVFLTEPFIGAVVDEPGDGA